MNKQIGLMTTKAVHWFLLLQLIVGVSLISDGPSLYAKGQAFNRLVPKLSFEKRLELYLNEKSRRFINEMALDEQALEEFEKNLQREIRRRGLSELPIQLNVPFDSRTAAFHRRDLVREYSIELSHLLNLVRQLGQLEKASEDGGNTFYQEELLALRDSILRILEANSPNDVDPATGDHSKAMSEDEFADRNSTRGLRVRLSQISQVTQSNKDRILLAEIADQMEALDRTAQGSKDHQAEAVTRSYVHEVGLLLDILAEIEGLRNDSARRRMDVDSELENLRETIVTSLDNTLRSIMGYKTTLASNGPTVSDLFHEWKAVEFTRHQSRLARYGLQKKWLLRNGRNEEQSRMIENDLNNAFSNFIDGKYGVSQRQFDLILEDYGRDFEDFETVLFYRAESFFQQKLYPEAAQDYQQFVTNRYSSQYVGESLYRLMFMSLQSRNHNEFDKYADLTDSHRSELDKETLEKCLYLSAYHAVDAGQFDQAEEVLATFPSDSKYFTSANFLLGMVHVNQNNYARAIEIFKNLLSTEGAVFSPQELTNVKNHALLKLGLLYYQQGDYEEALKYFDQVTANHLDKDQGLIGSAWAYFKLDRVDDTNKQIDTLLRTEIASNYTYEALVLSAHCKRIMDNNDSAVDNLRFVANARKVTALSGEYSKERKEVFNQLAYLDQLEAEVLERRDRRLYQLTAELRQQLETAVNSFPYYGSSGSIMLDEFQGERQSIVNQIAQLDAIVSEAFKSGDAENAKKASEQRSRLLMSLDTYTADIDVENINSFLDYPHATKEGADKFRMSILRNLQSELDLERQRTAGYLAQVSRLQAYYEQHHLDDLTTQVDIDILKEDLAELKLQASRLGTELNETPVSEESSDFDQIAEFSGFGMSDQTYESYKAKDVEIAQLASNFKAITKFLETRKRELQRKVVEIEKDVRDLEIEMQKESRESQEKDRDEYFRESYFDKKKRESEDK